MSEKYIFPSRLKELRATAGITQAALGNAAGIRKAAVCMLENGERSPSFEVLCAIAEYFNVSLDYLVGRTDEASVAAIPQTVQPQAEQLSGQEKQLLDAFRGVDDEGRMRIIQTTMNIRDEVEKKTSRSSDPAVC